MDTRAVSKRIVKRVREAARPQLDEALRTKTASVANARKQRVLVVLRALDRELDQLDAGDRTEIERHVGEVFGVPDEVNRILKEASLRVPIDAGEHCATLWRALRVQ